MTALAGLVCADSAKSPAISPTLLLLLPALIGVALSIVAHFMTALVTSRARDQSKGDAEPERSKMIDRVEWGADAAGISPALAAPLFGLAVSFANESQGFAVIVYTTAMLVAIAVPFAMASTEPERYLSRKYTRLRFSRATVASLSLNSGVLIVLGAHALFK